MQKIRSFANNIAFFILLMIIALITSSINLNAYPEIESYVYLNNDDINMYNSARQFQQHIVFSNITLKYYVFYSRSDSTANGLRYDILNYDGSIYKQNIIIGDGLSYTQHSFVDYDVRIDFYGQKLYFWVTDYSTSSIDYIYCIYGIINTLSNEIDFVSTSTVDSIAHNKGYYNLMGMITKTGYPALVCIKNDLTNQYSQKFYYSDSNTNWNTYTEVDLNSLLFAKTGLSYGDYTIKETAMICPYENGLMIIHPKFHDVNERYSIIASYYLSDYNNLLDGYVPADFSYVQVAGNTAQYGYGDYVNIAYNYDEDILVLTETLTTTNRVLRKWIWNDVPKTWSGEILKNEVSAIQYPILCSVNDRNSFIIIESNVNNDNFYIYRWNKGISNFDDRILLWEYSLLDDDITEYTLTGNNYVVNYGIGEYANGTISTILIDGQSVPTDDLWLSFFGLDADVFPPLPINYIKLDSIENNIVEDYGVIIFPNESHNIEMNFNENTTYMFVDFEDEENYIRFNYNVTENNAYTTIINKKGDIVENIAYLDSKTIVDNGNNLTLSFNFIFSDKIIDYYSQILDYGLLYNNDWYNFTSQIKYSIFNLGGIPIYSGGGTYNIYSDNDIFSIGAYGDGSYVRFDALYNKLQHMHFGVELDIDGDWNSVDGIWENCTGGLFEYGMDYFINDELLEGWKVVITPYNVVVGHQNLGVDYDYVQWEIDHYIYDRILDDYQLVKTDFLYSNFNGYDNEDSTPDYHNKTSATFWFDMWFSNDNSSRKVATRINTEWYGMYEQGSSWWFSYGGFRPVIGELTNSICYNNIYDTNNIITTIKDNVDLVRFWGRIEKVTGGSHEYKMYNYLMKNKVIAQGDMIGVDTPSLIETKVMDMPQTGFLAPLIKVLSDIQKMIIMGIIGALSYLSTLIDIALVDLGLPPLLSIFYNMLVSIYSIFSMLYNEFINIMLWIIDALDNVISSLFLVMPRYILFVGMIVSVFGQYYNTLILLFTGGIGGMGNFWADYPVTDFIQLYLICIFPFIEIAKIESSKDPLGTFMEDVKTFIDMIMGLFNFLYALLQVILDLLSRLLGILPF